MPTVKEGSATIIELANDGFEAALQTFSMVASLHMREYANVNFITAKYKGNMVRAFHELIKTVIAIKDISDVAALEEETPAEAFIELMFPKLPAKTGIGVKVHTPAGLLLRSLAELLKRYQIISVLATRLRFGMEVFDQLRTAVRKLREQYEYVTRWAEEYALAFKSLQERNHIPNIDVAMAELEKEFVRLARAQTEVRRKEETTRIMREELGRR